MEAPEGNSPPSRLHRPSRRHQNQLPHTVTSGSAQLLEQPQTHSIDSLSLPQPSRLPLEGLSISVSGCLGQKADLLGIAEQLGAVRHDGLREDTTHLVTDAAEGKKYEAALKLGIAIQSDKWLPAVREAWNGRRGFDLAQLERRHRLLPLHGVVFALTQFDQDRATDLGFLLTRTGATYTSYLNADVTHLIVASAPPPYPVVHTSTKLYRVQDRPQDYHPCLKIVWEGWAREVIRVGGKTPEEFWQYREGLPEPIQDLDSTLTTRPLHSVTSDRHIPSLPTNPSLVGHPTESHHSAMDVDVDEVPRHSSSPLNSTPPLHPSVPVKSFDRPSPQSHSPLPLPLQESPISDLLSQVRLSPVKSNSHCLPPSVSPAVPLASPRPRRTPRPYQQREDPVYQQLQSEIFEMVDTLDWIDGVTLDTARAKTVEKAQKLLEQERERVLGQKMERKKEADENRKRRPARQQRRNPGTSEKLKAKDRTAMDDAKQRSESRPAVALIVPSRPSQAIPGARRSRSRSADREALLAVTDGPSPSKRSRMAGKGSTRGMGKENETSSK